LSFEVSGGFGVVFSDEVLCSCLGGCLCRLFVPGRFLFGRFCAGQLSAEFCSSCFPFLNSYCPVIGCLFFFFLFLRFRGVGILVPFFSLVVLLAISGAGGYLIGCLGGF
jgi:hypothetical protein